MILSGSEAVSLIASASEDQTRGIADISQAVARMESVTGNTAANAGQTAESASAMSAQVQKTRAHLDELVSVVGIHRHLPHRSPRRPGSLKRRRRWSNPLRVFV